MTFKKKIGKTLYLDAFTIKDKLRDQTFKRLNSEFYTKIATHIWTSANVLLVSNIHNDTELAVFELFIKHENHKK